VSSFEFETDDRNPPDGHRKRRFKAGWNDAAMRGKIYQEETLRHLTWTNLGYRLGQKFGVRDETEMDEVYRSFAEQYEQTKRNNIDREGGRPAPSLDQLEGSPWRYQPKHCRWTCWSRS
jgi:hypothetical protein